MLLSFDVIVKINNRNRTHFQKLNYLTDNEIITVKVSDLMPNSRTIIECSCDNCDFVRKMTYQKFNQFTNFGKDKYYCNKCSTIKNRETCLIKYGVDHYSKTEEFNENNKKIWIKNLGVDHPSKSIKIKDKMKQTWLKNLGVEHPSRLEETIEKTKKTNISKYGVCHPMQLQSLKNKIRETNISIGRWYTHDVNLYLGYRKIVDKITKLNKKILMEKWDGFDYYDGDYIKNNFELPPRDRNYPTIDHKKSILYGFLNNLSPEEISSLDNLCITKLWINSTKNSKNEFDFKI